MRLNTLITLCTLATIVAGAAFANEAEFARYPAPSPDGKVIAFSYHGDIWVVPTEGGRAYRLTVHEAYDHRPVWSPDGSMIAFSSDRFGYDDVFVMNSEGGQATRLTFLSTNNLAEDWTADGQSVIFTSLRDYSISGSTRVPYVLSVPVNGGEPTPFMPEAGNEPILSAAGDKLAFVTHSRRDWSRIGYRGKSNNDIWIWNPADDTYERITDFLGSDACPMWAGDNLYYLSEESGVYNIWLYNAATGEKIQVTNHDDHVRFPSISRDGSVIAYELGLNLYTFNTATGESSKLDVIAPSDSKFNTYERKTFSSEASEYAVSPDESEIAFVIRGEVFVMEAEGGEAHRITNTSAREIDLAWNKEGTALFFSSDRNGNYDIFMAESDDPEEKKLSKALAYNTTQLTDTPERESKSTLSPDGKKLAYVVNESKLHIMDLETKESAILLDGWYLRSFSWSPDSRWIAYAREDREFNNDIWVIPATGGDAVNITKHPDNEYNPIWSKDGKRLAFVSRRMANNMDLWYVYLTREDHERSADEWEEYYENGGKKKAGKPGNNQEQGEEKAEEEKEPELEVTIDFENIHMRLQRVTNMAGFEGEAIVSPDGKLFAFESDNGGEFDLYTVKYDGKELKQLTKGGTQPQGIKFDSKSSKVYFIGRGGRIQSVDLSGKIESMNFSARMVIDYPDEHMQKYDEAWRTLDRMFYDGNFHGADWPAVREKYRPYAEAAVAERDFSDVVNMIFGNLNASHLGYRYFDFSGPRENSGHLGIIFDPDFEGPGLKVAEVLKDSPAYKVASAVKPGQILLAIDGTPVSWQQNVAELLIDKVGKDTVLTVSDSPEAETTSRIIIRPTDLRDIRQLMYERFVDHARKRVHEMSDGRLGYLHVQAMGEASLERFEMELYSEAHDKDAIVIDVRNNGGGWTTDMMLAILQVRDHARTKARGSDVWGYPQDRRPLYAWTRPIIVLCNEYSYSNAEIFSWAIKTLGRGTVVGMDTSGAVISTSGYSLIDGSYVRTPFRAWHVIGSDINMENNGCPPDIRVEYMPGDSAKGLDRQLEAAVTELLRQLENQ